MHELDEKHQILYQFFSSYIEYNFALLRIKCVFESNQGKMEKQKMMVGKFKSLLLDLDHFLQDLMAQEEAETNQILEEIKALKQDFTSKSMAHSNQFNSPSKIDKYQEGITNSNLDSEDSQNLSTEFLQNNILFGQLDWVNYASFLIQYSNKSVILNEN